MDRQAEIAKKRAKLQELKRARELRQQESKSGSSGDVCAAPSPDYSM
jgi:hypothetical protein